MEETLGKRIVAHRKRLGITQDRLAEQLGVTAQAVSKWENDQSCPDITMLPKLAEIFGISVDALLGLAEPVHQAEVITESNESGKDPKHNWELRWDAGRKSSVGLAGWVLLVGILMLANIICNWHVGLWDIIWPSAVMVFGLTGLFPKFSFVNFGCALFGGYFLLENLHLTNLGLGAELALPIVVILFGLSLLADALRKPKTGTFVLNHNGNRVGKTNCSCTLDEDGFDCDVCFGEDRQHIDLKQLRRGSADVSFGELTLDLTGCEEFAPGCHIDADCSFGDLTILIPKYVRAEVDSDSAFGSVDVRGDYDREANATIRIDADVSFGQITVKYV